MGHWFWDPSRAAAFNAFAGDHWGWLPEQAYGPYPTEQAAINANT